MNQEINNNVIVGEGLQATAPVPDQIILTAGGNAMLVITPTQFIVRGQPVQPNQDEVATVYQAFRDWLIANNCPLQVKETKEQA